MKIKLGQTVVCKWLDANASHETWRDPKNLALWKCTSVGYLVRRTRKIISIAAHSDNHGYFTGIMAIPRVCVTSIRKAK